MLDTPQIRSTPKQLKLISINTQGLNMPHKRSNLLTLKQKQKLDIVLIQETNFQPDQIPKLSSQTFPTVHHTTNNKAKSKGVSIFISTHLPLQITDIQVDIEGRFLLLKGKLHDKPIRIVNLYYPNKKQTSFPN